ncbi:hypothetical protein D3C71_2073300 [compost metagenome]
MEQILFIIVHGQNENFGIGIILFDLPGSDQSAFAGGHAKIHDQNVGTMLGNHRIRFKPIRRSADNLNVFLKIKDHRKPASDNRMIIRNNDSHS